MNLETTGESADIELELLIQAIFLKYQYDFRHYSRPSLKRRLDQALIRLHCSTLSALQEKILYHADFFPRLLNYLTVPTTEMFRDPSYFLSLKKHILPFLRTYPSLKIWMAGCSTGEEVFSLAILLKEEGLLDKTLIYATDINPHSLEKAKMGIYDKQWIARAEENYQFMGGKYSLQNYYNAAYDAVQFDLSLVKNAVFCDHSLATDAVFAEVNFVSCRNVLIYFERVLQNRAVGLFRDSLMRQGILGIGAKESLHLLEDKNAFVPLVESDRIFQKK